MKFKLNHKEILSGYLLIAPAVILFLLIGVGSIFISVRLSFFHVLKGSRLENAVFAGLSNFKEFLFGGSPVKTQMFWNAILNNTIIAVSLVLISVPLGLIIAFLLQQIKYGVKQFRTIFLIPLATSSVAIYYVWKGIYDPFGTLNEILKAINLDNLAVFNGWLGDMSTALPAIIVVLIWGTVPTCMLLYFAGLQTIDHSLFEAADIDGAKIWQKFIHIVWPLLQPITVIVVIMTLNSAFQVFEQVLVLTGGGPGGVTNVVNLLVYNEAFINPRGDLGVANAMGWTIFMITFVLSMISIKSIKDKTQTQ